MASSPKRMVVTGSTGLIGSEVCLHFARLGWQIVGVDNNMRAIFFGAEGDTAWNRKRMSTLIVEYDHRSIDIRDRHAILSLYRELRPDATVHAAAQPSHDLAAQLPFEDFDTNAAGTLNLIEANRQYSPESPFIHLSTNKVYGDRPNLLPMIELPTRWEYSDPLYQSGINEEFSIDQSTHSLFGASKLAADVTVQEYGRYFKMPTCCLRGGCLTRPLHSGVELHGFLNYLVRCNIEGRRYTIFGYKGKQVRDNIHSADVARFIELFLESPRCGAVYNIGGGKENSCSVLEAIEIVSNLTGKPMLFEYSDTARSGDHICYYSDLRKAQEHYPTWRITRSLRETIEEMAESWESRCANSGREHRGTHSIPEME